MSMALQPAPRSPLRCLAQPELAKGKTMDEQRIVVFLLEGVRTAGDALRLEKAVTIGSAKCRAVLPVMGRWPMFLAGAPTRQQGRRAGTSGGLRMASDAWGEGFVRLGHHPVCRDHPRGSQHPAGGRAHRV